jgi:hypothetical protein
MLRRCVVVVSFVVVVVIGVVTSVGVISGMLRGRGVGVGLGGKSGLVWVWCRSGWRNLVRISLVLSLLLTPPIRMPFSM